MKKIVVLIILVGTIFLLAACNTTPGEPAAAEPAANQAPNNNTGMGMMGMGGNMRSRHHATIPTEYAGLINPIGTDPESLARGAEIYVAQCATCHGDGGMGDGPAAAGLDPAPASIAHTSQMLGDDYLFWRVSEGGQMEPFNSTMIAWKGVLDEEARWDVINYVQALGNGTVTPKENMGGATFDPEVEQAQRTEMLTSAVEKGAITQEEADIFELVHTGIDGYMTEMRDHNMGSMDDMLPSILATLVSNGKITQLQADTFIDVHDRLNEAGLMQ